MEYVKKFLHVEGIIGQGAFGRVLVTSPLQNQTQVVQQPQLPQIPNGQQSPISEDFNQKPQEDLLARHQKSGGKLSGHPDVGGTRFALKCVHPILKPQRLANELRHLRDLGGQCNVVQMHTAHFYMGSLYIVMELIEHDRFVDIVAQLDYNEIVMYMKNLLIALEHVHEHNIMHRDIKPANFLFNRKNKKFLLVDFGLAQTVRTRSALFGNRQNSTYSNSTSLSSAPTTPTTTSSRRLITPLFPETKPNIPFVNLKSTHIIHQSPARHYINLKPTGSPGTPNISTKRHLPEVLNSNDFNQMLKKLRVSNNDEAREPVKLTVGAYESPVTHNDSGNRRNLNQRNHKFSTPTIPSRRTPHAKCDCRGKPKTCSICLTRPDSNAPKSGTPGFKAPEILLRYPHQTTSIDIWSAGVILACLLSGHTPFFRDVDDNVSLAEIITILGSHKVSQAAKALGIRLNVEPKREPVDLVQLCKTIRMSNKDKRQIELPDSAFDLLVRMLDPNSLTRITASEALKHSWFNPMTEV